MFLKKFMVTAKRKLIHVLHIHVRYVQSCTGRYVPDFWLLYECYLDGLEGLEQATDFIHTEILGKLKLQNLDKTQRL